MNTIRIVKMFNQIKTIKGNFLLIYKCKYICTIGYLTAEENAQTIKLSR